LKQQLIQATNVRLSCQSNHHRESIGRLEHKAPTPTHWTHWTHRVFINQLGLHQSSCVRSTTP